MNKKYNTLIENIQKNNFKPTKSILYKNLLILFKM